ncbi:hypothetical protein ACNIS1_25625, partial [Escherichia coli]
MAFVAGGGVVFSPFSPRRFVRPALPWGFFAPGFKGMFFFLKKSPYPLSRPPPFFENARFLPPTPAKFFPNFKFCPQMPWIKPFVN